MATKKKKVWTAMTGINLKDERYEVGDPVPNPPKWMIEQGKVI